jgi:hypothetical protein
MTDSHRPFDKTALARMRPERTRASGFWTGDRPEAVWLMDRATAEEVLGGLSLNNPRIVRAEKALTLITAQRDANKRFGFSGSAWKMIFVRSGISAHSPS